MNTRSTLDDDIWGFLMHAGAIDEARTTQRGARGFAVSLRRAKPCGKQTHLQRQGVRVNRGFAVSLCWSPHHLLRTVPVETCSFEPSVRRRIVPMDASDLGKVSQAAPSPVGSPAYIGWSVASRWISPPLALHHTDQVREDMYRISALGRISVLGGIVGF
jgi:hypothetical protein